MRREHEFVLSNLRLAELVTIVNANKPFFDDFIEYLRDVGYPGIPSFLAEKSDKKALAVILGFLQRTSKVTLLDGVGRPYDNAQARWYFLGWLLRDAPAQRLRPMVDAVPGATTQARQAYLLNEIRKFVGPLFPAEESWGWATVSEVMLARLEGSRRALKGTLFEAIVRRTLKTVLDENRIKVEISPREVRILDETYDVQVSGPRRSILIPIKTRETMGGGHAMLFTRDIHKSIAVAEKNGYQCLPVVIAESWGGDLKSLKCENYIYIKVNPNQVPIIEPLLADRFRELIGVFRDLARY
jgi:hypothetical protein